MSVEIVNFNFLAPIQVKMSDLDPFNHVNNGDQCHYFDYGRSCYFEHVLQQKIDWLTFDLVLVHIDLDFHQGIEFHDEIVCGTKVLEIGNKSFKMVQQLIDKNTGKVKTTCHSVLCGFDRENQSSIPIQELYRKRLCNFEGL
ncbi:MAG: thioesterase family protein [Bacteroidales bacterium]|nr:thioesterase family protein [Bacteroidales bacterium]